MKNIRKRQISIYALCLLSIFPVLNTAGAAQVNIADFLKKDKETVWTMPAADFQKNNGSRNIYSWNSAQKQSLHYAANRKKGSLYFLNWRVTEADFGFKNNQLISIFLNIYNKSCSTNRPLAVNKNIFVKFLHKLRNSLDTFCKTGHSRISTKLISGARCQSCAWNGPDVYVVFKWSYSGTGKYNFIAHYASVYIYKDKQAFNEKSRSKVTSAKQLDLKSRIKTNKNGDRYLQIPMVDQGKRGYCVVACAERILKYYNVNIDQHILAQAANTSNYGTRITDIEKSLKKVGVKCHFRVKEILKYSPITGRSPILKFVRKYNRYAKHAGRREINIYKVKTYNQLFRMMDEDILVQTRISSDKNGFKKFKARVKATTDSGMPVLWGVILGIVKEAKLPQKMGGHMRLITGYNPKTDEMIYSDSWGKGHDFKKISWGKAWAMTQMAYVFIPRKY